MRRKALKMRKSVACLAATVILFSLGAVTACTQVEKQPASVYYSEFGAVGDGATDDFEAIIATHAYANERGLTVKADPGAEYYIGAHTKTAIIRTDTDWGDAKFTIDDRGISYEDKGWYIFEVQSDYPSYKINVPMGYKLQEGQKELGLSFESPVLLNIKNSNKKDYIRYGKNQNSGSDRQEMILVDEDGVVNETTPILWDYDEVTSITAYPVSDDAITVKGGEFTTIANDAAVSANYYARGINVKRSNTTLYGIKHFVTGEGETSSPYTGFYVVNYANHVAIESCVLTGHKTYTNIKETGPVSQGTYDTQAVRSNDVAWLDCTQSNDITDTTYWGVMASNFCKNLRMEGCSLSRFDAHQGVYNATITDTELGQNLTIIGAGTLRIDNVKRLSGNHFMQLRTDYGSTWKGDIVIENCSFTPNGSTAYIILAEWKDHNFGYQCHLPQTVTLSGFKVETDAKCYVFSSVADVSPAAIKSSKNPYVFPKKVVVLNEVTPLSLSSNTTGLFSEVLWQA